jgi:hypothetical protein
MQRYFMVGTVLFGTLLGASQVSAQGVKDCDGALIVSTYSRQDRRFLDWRLAEKVDEQTYSQLRRDASANATIYGVPMGANYGEFRNNGRRFQQERQQSFTEEQTRNIQWTGLDPNAVTAYSQCLRAFAQSRPGLHLVPKGATDADIAFEVVYTIAGAMPNPVRVQWVGGSVAQGILPSALPAGSTTVVVKRPDRQHTLGVNASGFSNSIVLTPLPSPPDPFESECVVATTPEPVPVLRRGGSTSWTCPPMSAGTYTASVLINPSSSPALAFRVHWAMTLSYGERESRTTVELNRASGDPIDINVNAGLGSNFQVSAQSVQITQGVPVFTLRINGVANHCCFHTTNYDDGSVLVPVGVQISLKKQ